MNISTPLLLPAATLLDEARDDRHGRGAKARSAALPPPPLALPRRLFAPLLQRLPLGLVRLQSLEGGPETSLSLRAGGVTRALVGSDETGFNESDANVRAWPLPSALGVEGSPAASVPARRAVARTHERSEGRRAHAPRGAPVEVLPAPERQAPKAVARGADCGDNRGMARPAGSTANLDARLEAEVTRVLGGVLDAKRWALLGRALAGLHQRFVADLPPESGQAPYLADRPTLAAYLAYFFPASAAQVTRALQEVAPPAPATVRLLDVGSGPGPAGVAAARWLQAHGKAVELTALEVAPAALDTLGRLWSGGWGTLTTRSWRAGDPLPEGPFDVIVASHVLNELFTDEVARLDRRAKFAQELAARLAPGGLLLLLEPALKRTGRELLVVRDRLLAGGLFALAPCLFQGACPAIARPRDWCHADRPWSPPPLVVRAAEEAGLARESLKFSYVILSNRPPPAERAKDVALFRIVSEPLPEKGKLRYFGCGPSGRHPLVRLDREATDANAAFSTLDRGDVVRIDGTVASGDGKRVGGTSPVVVVVAAKDRDGAGG